MNAGRFQKQFTLKMNSYVPELRRREDEPGSALLLTCRDLLEIGKNRVAKLPQKHRTELYNRFLPENLGYEKQKYAAYVYFTSDKPTHISAEDAFLGFDGRTEAVYHVLESYQVNPTELSGIYVTQPERDSYTRLYCGGDGEFNEIGFGMEKESPQNYAAVTIVGHNLLIGLEPPLLAADSVPALYENADAFVWTLETEDFCEPVEVTKEEGGLRLNAQKLPGVCGITARCEKAAELLQGNIYMPSLSCEGKAAPDYLSVEGEICFDSMFPFGFPLIIGGECFIACNAAFGIPGAAIELSFTVSYYDEFIPFYGIIDDCKIPEAKECCADGVTIQYFNGGAFVPFKESPKYRNVFAAEGEKKICLNIPDDSKMTLINGIEAYWIRLRADSCENRHYNPLIIHSPKIENIEIQYNANPRVQSVKYENIEEERDITALLPEGFPLFSPLYPKRRLYLSLQGTLPQSLNIYIQREKPCHMPVIGNDWSLISSCGCEPVEVIDNTGGFMESGILSFKLPQESREAVKLFDGEGLCLSVTIISDEGLAGITDIRPNVCLVSGNVPLPAGAALQGKTNAEMFCDSALASPRPNYGSADGAKFYLINRERYMTEPAIRQAVLWGYPDVKECLCRYDAKKNTVTLGVHFGEGETDAFSLQKEGLLLFLCEHCPNIAVYTIAQFAPVYVSVKAAVDSDRISGLAKALRVYIEDKTLWKPGVLPGNKDIAVFLTDTGVSHSYLTVMYSSEANGKASLRAEDFPFALAASGTHELIVREPEREKGGES